MKIIAKIIHKIGACNDRKHILKPLHYPPRHVQSCLALISGIIMISLVVTSGIQPNNAFGKPNFELNSVGVQCAGEWANIDKLLLDAREKRGSAGWDEDAHQDKYRELLNQWNGFCGKYYGNYHIPKIVSGLGNANVPLTGSGVLEQAQEPPKDANVPLKGGGVLESNTDSNENKDTTAQRLNTPSPTGYCLPVKSQCIPCDPGLPGNDCVPNKDWPPASVFSSKDTGSSQPSPKSNNIGITDSGEDSSDARATTSQSNQGSEENNSIVNELEQDEENDNDSNETAVD